MPDYVADERAGVLTVQLARRAHLRSLAQAGFLSALAVPVAFALPRMWLAAARLLPDALRVFADVASGRPPKGPTATHDWAWALLSASAAGVLFPLAVCLATYLTFRSFRGLARAARGYWRGGVTFAFDRGGWFSVNGGRHRRPADALLVRSYFHRDSGDNEVVDEQFLYLVRGRRRVEVLRSPDAAGVDALASLIGTFIGLDVRRESSEGMGNPFRGL